MDDMLLEKAKGIINQLEILYRKHDELQRKLGEKFNIFSILNMERLEVRTHSAFIYELINYNGSHCQGTSYLDLFIKNVLQINDFNLNKVIVERERSVGNLGRLDLVIENDEEIIIIEMKIDALDQIEQLKRYAEYGRRTGKQYKIYYLTLDGKEASEISTGEVLEELNYTTISFSADILNWIELCIKVGNTPFLPNIRELLKQYSNLIKKITNQMDGGLRMDIKELLLKDNNLKIIDEVSKIIPYVKAEIEYNFWEKLYKIINDDIEEMGFKFVYDEEFLNDRNAAIKTIIEARKLKSGDYYIDFIIGYYKKFEIRVCIGYIGNEKGIYVLLALVDNEGSYVECKEYDDKILKVIDDLGFDKVSKYKYKYLKADINFQDNCLYSLSDINYMDEAVNNLGIELINIFSEIKQSKYFENIIN